MKLLTKPEVQREKASERKVEIDQGVMLAKKIDVLRETFSKEEANLAKFRLETLRLVQKEIDDRILQRNNLDRELEIKNERVRQLKELISQLEIVHETINISNTTSK